MAIILFSGDVDTEIEIINDIITWLVQLSEQTAEEQEEAVNSDDEEAEGKFSLYYIG